ncbi:MULTISPECIES: glycosyltransferase family 4 protein [unclassified Clostridium]|uniref:glycosyltransferase family 4 protein n=1 Tax=unclassified Clostridium TaxID=2614128 RepID=UPI000297DE59|nr:MULTISPECIES: glycosyltransferase family 4 protein [unclassified Clostridium]EKQ50534.1 MAG: glycosyltransferase [Clostridium sp. Maddingley MBC34-26]
MEKPRLLYASPLLPKKSGISDYSEILIYGLKKYFSITILIDNYTLKNKELYKDFDIKIYEKDKIDYNEYQHIIYNIGNNPDFHMYMYDLILKYSGYVILHDYSLFYLTSGYYQQNDQLFSKIYELEGSKGIHIVKKQLKQGGFKNILECKTIADKIFLNKEILDRAKGIIVHSNYTKEMLENRGYNNVLKINMVNMSNDNILDQSNDYLKKKYNISDEDFVIGSFGNIAPTKQNHIICEAVKHYNEVNDKKIYYIMSGDGDYVDSYLDKFIIKTGFIDIAKYNSILKRVNVVFNLRYPSMGETSISLIHAMGMKKACVITNDAWFKEIPDSCALKIEADEDYKELAKLLAKLVSDNKYIEEIKEKAYEYIGKEYELLKTCKTINEFILRDK